VPALGKGGLQEQAFSEFRLTAIDSQWVAIRNWSQALAAPRFPTSSHTKRRPSAEVEIYDHLDKLV
jgi:hypothetical protein